ncbi:hypothetical protein BMF94_2470 [Rhodotorula taiwanensis]|uniref:Rab-GAP TBC domain-containing protein n=1 Tax=Rhodotorula taiwanensis TaxID=741276 RepID=A0A2S5BCL2_9BASI|nr:hypothetical protein BMF94_2470 [Rhodotorula taiwanensis]
MPLWGRATPSSPTRGGSGDSQSDRSHAASSSTASTSSAPHSLGYGRAPSAPQGTGRAPPHRSMSTSSQKHVSLNAATSSSSSSSDPRSSGNRRGSTPTAVPVDDDGTWNEASDDDDLPADALGGLSLRDDRTSRRGGAQSTTAAAAAARKSISPIRTGEPYSASGQSPTSAGSTWSFNPFSLRPAARPSHASTSSSLFGTGSSTTNATSGSSPASYFPATGGGTSPAATPSVLYSYSRATPAAAATAAGSSRSHLPDSVSTTSLPVASPGLSSAGAGSVPSPSLGAEAVAAALSGRPGGLHTSLQRGTSYLAGASRVQEEADRVVQEEVEEERRRSSIERGQAPRPLREEVETDGEGHDRPAQETEGGEGHGKEKCKRAVRRDVADLVKDPAHVLARLRTAWQPRPAPSRTSPAPPSTAAAPDPSDFSNPGSPELPSHPPPPPNGYRKRPTAITGGSGKDADSDSDSGPPLGYAPLNANAFSSHEANLIATELEPAPPNPEEEGERGRENRRKRKFLEVLGDEENVDLAELRKLAWSGVPNELRPMVWQLLLGYLPGPIARRTATLARKRTEYASLVKQAFSRGVKGLDGPLWHQISIDVPRTRPGVPLWQAEATQRSLERVLYVWAIRHPASGYVQGINDLVTPFFQVFLASYIDADPETFDVSVLPPEVLEALEADSFWCLSKLLDGIQDNYIFAQPGIQRLVKKMEVLCGRVDAPLAAHLKEQGVEFIQFAFRWMNCLLMRELSVKNIVRMWDTYLAEGGDAFSEFHLYVCLAFLVRWSEQLREMDFQSIIMFLQSLPTQEWSDKDTELLLSEAFMWSRTFVAR